VECFGTDEKQKPNIKWEEFRAKLDNMTWVRVDSEKLKKRIDDLYKQVIYLSLAIFDKANKLINTGQGSQAPPLLHKANRLENVLSQGI
jgi:hypothetical protein